MKHLFTLLFLLGSLCTQAQTITGKVTDATTNTIAVGATIKLVGKDKGTITDAEGKFSLEGTGSIQVSFVGYKTFEIKAKNKFLELELMPQVAELQTVEVIGRSAKDYHSDYSFSATKIAALNKDIP